MKIKDIIKWLINVVAAGIIAILMLSIFTCIYHYEGVHVRNNDGATDYKWETGQWKSQMTEGFAWFFMDEEGFNNHVVPKDKIDLLLMGSSHMEGCEVSQAENVGTLLNDSFTDLVTYNIGISGHTIYRCVDNLEDAIDTYHPQKYIVMETDRVELSIDQMKSVIEQTAEPIPSYDSGIIYYMQKVPAVKLLYSQFENWISMGSSVKQSELIQRISTNTPVIEKSKPSQEYKTTVNDFLSVAAEAVDEAGCKLIIFYQPTTKLKADGTLNMEINGYYLDEFRLACEDNGIIFVDMTDDFLSLYENEHTLAHGFSNTAVGVGHLNSYGHAAIAARLKMVITELEEN